MSFSDFLYNSDNEKLPSGKVSRRRISFSDNEPGKPRAQNQLWHRILCYVPNSSIKQWKHLVRCSSVSCKDKNGNFEPVQSVSGIDVWELTGNVKNFVRFMRRYNNGDFEGLILKTQKVLDTRIPYLASGSGPEKIRIRPPMVAKTPTSKVCPGEIQRFTESRDNAEIPVYTTAQKELALWKMRAGQQIDPQPLHTEYVRISFMKCGGSHKCEYVIPETFPINWCPTI